MVNQRIVLEMDMSGSERSMKKAMQIASAAFGVRSVSVQGKNDDQLVLIGEGIDLAKLTRKLNRKVCQTSIVTVQATPQPSQKPPQPYYTSQYNEMPPVRRCICEIPYSGSCGVCRPISQNTYNAVAPSYPPPVINGPYPDAPDGCRIL